MIVVDNKSVRRRDKRVWFVVLGVFVAVFLFAFMTNYNKSLEKNADAVNLAGFDPGYIISDYQMGNYNSMNESQIQAFLKSKNSCNDTSIGRYTVGDKVGYFSEMSPPRTWHIKDGHFVCMADEVFDGGTAAHIIYQASRDYRINPQVLLVLLEKEQSLVRDTFPNSQQYRSATGYGCPDTAECSSKYYGLKNQIRNAAELFRTVLDGGWTNYPLGNNYVQYNPNAACGGSVVNIRNLATSALYRYTPYQPNQATLGGWNDGCNAYGNMNFYSFFQDWFGGIAITKKLESSIPDGSFQITAKDNSNLALDIYGGIINGMKEGKIITYNTKVKTDRTLNNQVFEVKYEPSTGYYRIYNSDVNLYFENNNDNIIMSTKKDNCSQRWILRQDNDGYFQIISSCSDKPIKYDSYNKWKFFEISDSTHQLVDGKYFIKTELSDKYALDISGGVTRDTKYGKIKLWMKKQITDDISNQVFDVKYDDNTGYYNIINTATGTALDVYNADVVNNSGIIIWPQHKKCNQKWLIRKVGNNYNIFSACSGKSLDVSGGVAGLNKEIIIYTPHSGLNQRWTFEEVKQIEGEYSINPKFNMNLTIGSESNYLKTINNNEKTFMIKKDDFSQYYYIYDSKTNKYLDVKNASTMDGSEVIFWDYNGRCNQKWGLEKLSEDSFIILSACSNKAIDIQGGNIIAGKNIIIYSKHGQYNQQWLLTKK